MEGKKYGVLVVDDEKEVRDVFVNIFKHGGAFVRSAGNQAEAEELLDVFEPDFALSDLLMPGGNGIDVMNQVKKRYPKTPVVIITGYGRLEDYPEKDRLGVFKLLHKPVSVSELLAVFHEALEMGEKEEKI
jgi:two-component system, NtrC family, response regulator PilR